MTNKILQEVACPNCQNPIDVREHGRHVLCDACSSRFILRGHLCPNCHSYHPEERAFCGQCGTAMQRVCIQCNKSNWAGDEFCAHCGEAMDIFELLALHQKDRRRQHEARRHEQIRRLREEEEKASQQRMENLQTEADAYQEELQRRQAVRKAEERKMIRMALAAVAVFLLIVIAFTLLTLS